MRDYSRGETIRVIFNTIDGAKEAVNMTNSPALQCVEAGTPTPFTAGVTLNQAYLGVVGLHELVIDTSLINYRSGFDYTVMFTAGEADGVALSGQVLFQFSLDRIAVEALKANSAYDALRPTIAGNTLNVANGAASTNVVAVGGQAATAAAPVVFPATFNVMGTGDIDGRTLEETLKLIVSALCGKVTITTVSGVNTVTFRAIDDSKARITATTDVNGNRSAVTIDTAG